MSDNWVVQNLENALNTWNEKLAEIWQLITQSPEQFKGGTIWNGLRFALAIISGKNILFVVPKRLRAFRNYFFTGKNKVGQPAGCPTCFCE